MAQVVEHFARKETPAVPKNKKSFLSVCFVFFGDGDPTQGLTHSTMELHPSPSFVFLLGLVAELYYLPHQHIFMHGFLF
jgi:hypothetical protein